MLANRSALTAISAKSLFEEAANGGRLKTSKLTLQDEAAAKPAGFVTIAFLFRFARAGEY